MADAQWLRDNAEILNLANKESLIEFADDYEKLEAENKAIIRRAEAAEEDWQLAEKQIKELKIENAKLNIILFHRENGLSHPDFNAEIEISKQAERIKELEVENKRLEKLASQLCEERNKALGIP